MSHQVAQTLTVNVPAAKLWQVMDDFKSVENYAQTIQSSPIVGDIQSGLGAKRQCTFKDGSSLIETITEYTPGEGYTMELSDYSMPLKSMTAKVKVKAINEHASELYMSSKFIVKGGPLGWLMGTLLMKPMMKGVFKKVMSGLAYYAQTSNRIDEKLPSNEQMAKILAH